MTRTLRSRWRAPLAALAVAVMGLTLASAAGAAPTVSFQQSYGFSGPAGLYAYGMEWDASDNTILVGDYWNYRVQRFSATGTHLATYPDVTGPKANGGIASAPYDIASDPTDLVGGGSSFWAADQGSSNFAEFSHSGAWLQTIGRQQSTVTGTDATHPGHSYAFGCGNGQMNVPTHIMVDTVASNHFLYVSDPACRNVYIFNHQGVFEGQLDWTGSGVGTPIPRGLAEDAAGNIYVAKYNSRRIFVFNSTTRNIIASSAAQSDLRDVRGSTLDPTRHLIYAAGAALNRVYEFSYDPATIATGTGPGSTVVRFVNEWRNTDGTNYALNHQTFDSIRFVAVDGPETSTPATPGAARPMPASACQRRRCRIPATACSSSRPATGRSSPAATRATRPRRPAAPARRRLRGRPAPSRRRKAGSTSRTGSPIDSGATTLYVVDTFEQRVQKFDTNQTCSSAGSCPAWSSAVGRPRAVQPRQRGLRLSARAHLRPTAKIWVGDNNNDVMDASHQHRAASSCTASGHRASRRGCSRAACRASACRAAASTRPTWQAAGCRCSTRRKLLAVPSGTARLRMWSAAAAPPAS